MIGRCLMSAACCLAFSTPGIARDIFVNNVVGDDYSSGSSESAAGEAAGPVRSIARAMKLIVKGDRLVLAKTDVPYHEMVSLSTGDHCGYYGHPFVIVGNGAILDGSSEVPGDSWMHVSGRTYRFEPEKLRYQQLFLEGRPAERVPAGRDAAASLQPLQWTTDAGWIYFSCEEDKIPADYALRYARLLTGITLYHVRQVRIENLIVQGFQLDGINAHDGCVDCALVNVTARGNGRSGISIGGASRLIIDDSLIGDNGRAQVRTEGYSIGSIRNSDVLDNTAPPFVITGGRLYVDGELQGKAVSY